MTSTGSAPSSTAGRRTRARLAVTGRPTRADLVDGGFVLVLGLVALWGFRTTFDSPRFLIAGAAGLLLGVAVAHIANILKQGWFVIGLMVVVTFFLFGGAVTMTRDGLSGMLSSWAVVSTLAVASVSGWKGLLTTLPPVDGGGQVLVLPYLLALVTGSLAFTLARRTRGPGWPTVVLGVLFAVVILLGTMEPAGMLVQGLTLAVGCFVWVVLRRRRQLTIVGAGSPRGQAVLALVLLVLAGGGATLVGGGLPGTDGERTVLRTYVQPPFDITQYPSPLVGFRKYTEGAQKVWDQDLFTVTGAPEGALVRIAVLDDYSGTVWSGGSPVGGGSSGGSGQDFRKVGSTIAPDPTLPTQTERTTITVRAAYAGLADASAWVPSIGSPTNLTFAGQAARALADSVRFNPSTGQALVAARLRDGDVIASTAVPVPEVSDTFQPANTGSLPTSATSVVADKATRLAGGRSTPWEQLQAIADSLQQGAYSDGTRAGETQYLPGHGVARTTSFLARPQLVGNDEQYASTFALMANSLGVPARVVMGAVVPAGGSVQGKDVHAWVELKAADGRWYAVPTARFTPDRSRTPEQQPRAVAKDRSATDVPPPNSQRPPGTVDTTFDTSNAVVRPPTLLDKLAELPPWVFLLLKLIAYPLLVIGSIVGGIALARALRRRRRKRHGPPAARFAQGWRDYVDHARDLGLAVPAGLTRREQAVLVGYGHLAAVADRAVFGPGDPSPRAVGAYWRQIGTAREALTWAAPRRRRLVRLVSLRGLLFRDARPVEQLPVKRPSAQQVGKGAGEAGRGRRHGRGVGGGRGVVRGRLWSTRSDT